MLEVFGPAYRSSTRSARIFELRARIVGAALADRTVAWRELPRDPRGYAATVRLVMARRYA